ncbi:MAG: RING finger protein [Candidatus Fimenecus sp.]
MRYTGETCPVCHKAFTDDDDVVVCPACGTPHHRACYAQQNKCANDALHSEGFVWTPAQPADTQQTVPVSTLLTQKPSASKTPAVQKPDDGHNIVFCPQCGAENAAEEPVCTQCGARLYNNAANGQPFLPPVQLPNGAAQGYRAGMVVISPTDTIDGNTVMDTAEYVQTASRRYIPKFYAMEKTGKKTSWNWAAFFFAPYWYFYRKLYGVGAILMVLLLAISGLTYTPRLVEKTDAFYAAQEQVQALLETQDASDSAAVQTLTEAYTDLATTPEFILRTVADLAVALFSGLFANTLYKKKAAKEIARLHTTSQTPEEYRLRLFRRGGVSVFLCIAAFWIYQLGGYLLMVAISKFLL